VEGTYNSITGLVVWYRKIAGTNLIIKEGRSSKRNRGCGKTRIAGGLSAKVKEKGKRPVGKKTWTGAELYLKGNQTNQAKGIEGRPVGEGGRGSQHRTPLRSQRLSNT